MMVSGEPLAGLITRDAEGIPCVGGMRLPAETANRMMADEAKAEADRLAAVAAPDGPGAEEMAFARRMATGQDPASGPTLVDIFAVELARSAVEQKLWDRGLAYGPGGRFVSATTGEVLPEVSMEPDVPESAARSITARVPGAAPDPVDVYRNLHTDLIHHLSRADYPGTLAAAQAKMDARFGDVSRGDGWRRGEIVR